MTSYSDISIEEVIVQLNASCSLPAELLEIFGDEANDHLQKIYEGLARLKSNRQDMQALGEVRRVSHTLKGAAGAVGQQTITRLAHRMEDLLDQLAEQNCGVSEAQLELLLNTADQLQELSTGEFESGGIAQQIVELYREFAEHVKSNTSCADPDQPPQQENRQDNESDYRSKDVASPGSDRSNQYLRVPLDRLDKMAKLMGEMTVNRSEFEHRIQEFAARIADMDNALERLRVVANSNQQSGFDGVRELQGKVCADWRQHSSSNRFRDEFDPLEFDQYSESYLLSQKLSEAESDAQIVVGEFNKLKLAFDGLLRRQQQLNRETQNSLMQVRLVPLSAISNQWERTVRTVSKKLNRPVELELIGKDIELDKTVLDAVADPIQHLIRNAIDHGVEETKHRIESGKSATAKLQLKAINHGTQVTLKISDDGAGLNTEKIRQKAIQKGLIDDNVALSCEELHALIFQPGFSTANQLSDVSGRGIGMDVVSDAVRRLKGTIRVDSESGVGTTFTIQIPTVVGVSSAVFLESAGHQFAIPIQSVQKFARLQPTEVMSEGNHQFTSQPEGRVRLVDLASHLGLRPISKREKPVPMLVIGDSEDSVAVTVDTIIGCRDIVVKGLGNHLKNIRGLAGVTIAGNGAVVPILNGADIVSGNAVNMLPDVADSLPLFEPKNLAMVIDDSISVRRVTESMLNFAGWDVVTATDGVDALAKLTELESKPDAFLCDLEMPRMDGLEFIRQVRDQSEFELTPIIMVTSRASEKLRHKAFDAGATEYLVKPYDRDALMELIIELVEAAREMV